MSISVGREEQDTRFIKNGTCFQIHPMSRSTQGRLNVMAKTALSFLFITHSLKLKTTPCVRHFLRAITCKLYHSQSIFYSHMFMVKKHACLGVCQQLPFTIRQRDYLAPCAVSALHLLHLNSNTCNCSRPETTWLSKSVGSMILTLRQIHSQLVPVFLCRMDYGWIVLAS